MENSFVLNVRAQEWYNGNSPRNLNGYLNDKSSRLIGWGRMRQLRIESHLCSEQKIREYCFDDYSNGNKDEDSYQPEWKRNETDEEYSSTILKAFQYQRRRGYVYEFRGRLSEMKK